MLKGKHSRVSHGKPIKGKKRAKKKILLQRELNSGTSCSQSKSFDKILFDKADCKEINLSTALHSEPQNVHAKRISLYSFKEKI